MSRWASPAALEPGVALARRRSRASKDGVKRMDSGVVTTTLYRLRYTLPNSPGIVAMLMLHLDQGGDSAETG
jgi:hypothetical protein